MTVTVHLGAAQGDEPHIVPSPRHDGVGDQHVLPHAAEGGEILDEYPIHAVKAAETEGTAGRTVGASHVVGHKGIEIVPVAPRVAHEATYIVVAIPDPLQAAALQAVDGRDLPHSMAGGGRGVQ